jgi:uncharacterized protein YcnI
MLLSTAAFSALALCSQLSQAHVTINPNTMPSNGKYLSATVRIGHSCNDNTSVVSVVMTLPPATQVTAWKPGFVYAWNSSVTLGSNMTLIAEGPKAYMPNSNFLDIPISLSLGTFAENTNLTFPTAQYCADGNVTYWNETVAGAAHPAPKVTIRASAVASAASTASENVASAQSTADTARSLGIAAVVISSVALLGVGFLIVKSFNAPAHRDSTLRSSDSGFHVAK